MTAVQSINISLCSPTGAAGQQTTLSALPLSVFHSLDTMHTPLGAVLSSDGEGDQTCHAAAVDYVTALSLPGLFSFPFSPSFIGSHLKRVGVRTQQKQHGEHPE